MVDDGWKSRSLLDGVFFLSRLSCSSLDHIALLFRFEVPKMRLLLLLPVLFLFVVFFPPVPLMFSGLFSFPWSQQRSGVCSLSAAPTGDLKLFLA